MVRGVMGAMFLIIDIRIRRRGTAERLVGIESHGGVVGVILRRLKWKPEGPVRL